ncbi:MAG TPA: phosphate starvation-inducible protein PhoH [Candidatus Marinimicrobia bacterium]|nr:phosphate starvation-inducible protein PhoH [Candidatus Neomarinimicrobiota bacterium]
MIKKEIEIKGVDPLLVFGVNDSLLKILTESFPLKIVARGNKIILSGEEPFTEQVNRIINEMLLTINRKGFLNDEDLKALINVELNGKKPNLKEAPDTIILYKKSGVIKPRSLNQERYYKSTLKNDIVFGIGPAGTGKTYLAVAIALAALRNHEVKRIVLTRPAVEAGESLGFLPGDLREKIEPYLAPLYDALHDMLPAEKLKAFTDQHIIEILPLAYMRGRTLNSSYVILDEAQNTSSMQMKMFLTRLGANSKAIITGDITQIDIPDKKSSGLIEAKNILNHIDGIDFIYFDPSDVVRHRLVKDIIKAYNGGREEG